MIDKLIIGPAVWIEGDKATANQIGMYSAEHPLIIRTRVVNAQLSKKNFDIATYNPLVMRQVAYEWRHDGGVYDIVYLRNLKLETVKLTEVLDINWLAHFSVEELFMSGEFDEWI